MSENSEIRLENSSSNLLEALELENFDRINDDGNVESSFLNVNVNMLMQIPVVIQQIENSEDMVKDILEDVIENVVRRTAGHVVQNNPPP